MIIQIIAEHSYPVMFYHITRSPDKAYNIDLSYMHRDSNHCK